MGDPVEERCCHLSITKDRDPFAELEIGGNDYTGLLIKLADQVKEERPTGFGERNITQFINDDTVCLTELADKFTSITFSLFLNQSVNEIYCVMETNFLALCDEGCSQGNGNMSFKSCS